MFKRILVPVDGSKPSGAGLRAAIALAREQKARIRFVHLAQVVLAPPPASGFAVSELYGLLRQAGEELLRRVARQCRQRGVECDTRLHVAIAERASRVILLGGEEVARRPHRHGHARPARHAPLRAGQRCRAGAARFAAPVMVVRARAA